ncbi:MAG: hypothetical protein JWM57_954 [Phycisphaerales bacterium]|nr:hypothetical protein [Phycisphaerales bacterium]
MRGVARALVLFLVGGMLLTAGCHTTKVYKDDDHHDRWRDHDRDHDRGHDHDRHDWHDDDRHR